MASEMMMRLATASASVAKSRSGAPVLSAGNNARLHANPGRTKTAAPAGSCNANGRRGLAATKAAARSSAPTVTSRRRGFIQQSVRVVHDDGAVVEDAVRPGLGVELRDHRRGGILPLRRRPRRGGKTPPR